MHVVAAARGLSTVCVEQYSEKYRRRFVATYGEPEEKMREAMTKASIKIDAKAREYYEAYTYMDKDGQERHLTEKMIEEYTINASVLGELEKMAQDARPSAAA